MKTYLLVILSFGMVMHLSMAKVSHLLVTSIGEGVVELDSSKEEKVISSSSFYPSLFRFMLNRKVALKPLLRDTNFDLELLLLFSVWMIRLSCSADLCLSVQEISKTRSI